MTRRRIRRQVKKNPDAATARQSSSITEQRNILRNRIRAWEEILPLYMPGLAQYRNGLESDASSNSEAERPEDAIIWLPSQIPPHHRSRVCYSGLADIEEKIRVAQCYDNLDTVRHVLNIKSRLVEFKNLNVRGQRDSTRSRMFIDRVHERAKVAAERYRVARRAKMALTGSGDWEETLRVLNDADIRGYRDPDRLRVGVGRRGTLEDEQVAAASVEVQEDMEIDDDVADENLFEQVREKRDGTGETRRMLSWIWTTKSRMPNPEDESDDILRVEWAKSRARAARCREEVLLLKEEMRRTIAFLDWKSKWWMDRQGARTDVTSKELREGLHAYAEVQADLQKMLKAEFHATWKVSLSDSTASLEDNEDDGNDDGDDDDDDDDDDGGEELL
jgi:hypothetical protein